MYFRKSKQRHSSIFSRVLSVVFCNNVFIGVTNAKLSKGSFLQEARSSAMSLLVRIYRIVYFLLSCLRMSIRAAPRFLAFFCLLADAALYRFLFISLLFPSLDKTINIIRRKQEDWEMLQGDAISSPVTNSRGFLKVGRLIEGIFREKYSVALGLLPITQL